MKLLRLPQLARIEVFKQLDPSEFFLFSLCSKQSFEALKVVKYRNSRLKVEPFSDYQTTYDSIKWNFFICISNVKIRLLCLTTNVMNSPKITNNTVWDIEDGEIIIDFTQNQLRGYCSVQSANIIRAVQKYICDLYSLPLKIIIKVKYGYDVYQYLIPNSIHTSFLDSYPTDAFLKNFYNFHPNQVLTIHQTSLSVNMHKSYGIHQVENLIVHSTWDGIKWYMTHFQGKNALFWWVNMKGFLVETFLEQWKKKTYDNLETIIAYQATGRIIDNVESITAEQEPWDTEKHRKVFPYNTIITEHHTLPEGTFDCEGGYFIRRSTDGKIATLKLTPRYFMFFVWK